MKEEIEWLRSHQKRLEKIMGVVREVVTDNRIDMDLRNEYLNKINSILEED